MVLVVRGFSHFYYKEKYASFTMNMYYQENRVTSIKKINICKSAKLMLLYFFPFFFPLQPLSPKREITS